jgi:hypothetical protein
MKNISVHGIGEVVAAGAAIAAMATLPLYSGARLDLRSPRKDTILLCDLAECLSRTDAAFAAGGFYTLAQRSCILAEQVGRAEGSLASCYALLWDTGLALLRTTPPFWNHDDDISAFAFIHAGLMRAICEAVDLVWPCPAAIAAALTDVRQQLLLRELLGLQQNAGPEILALRDRGVRPLGVHMATMPPEKARLKWMGSWKVYATAAQLPRTAAWHGLGR